MIKLRITSHTLNFTRPAGTSRGILTTKPSWYLNITDTKNEEKVGLGECSIVPGLSFDSANDLHKKLFQLSSKTYHSTEDLYALLEGPELIDYPSIKFGLETALIDFEQEATGILFPGLFTAGKKSIEINGLIWMGKKKFMFQQIKQKIEEGWNCIKIKIGAIDFEDEIELIRYIRNQFSTKDITIRVDANGAFSIDNALSRLQRLSELELHSIEQPIKAGQINEMARLCEISPLAIALDEELIGIHQIEQKKSLLKNVKPQFIILKPGLVGGIKSSADWMEYADQYGIDYWVTSALESNVGLNAIAQWTAHKQLSGHQGLGTGMLFTNNIPSPLSVHAGKLSYLPNESWDYQQIMR